MDYFTYNVGQGIVAASGYWYRCVQWLGSGGNADTYLVVATDGPNKGALFALKIFRKLSAEDRREAFLREVEFLGSCAHPSIMRVYDSGTFTVKGEPPRVYPFLVAEYLPSTLFDIMRAKTATVPQQISYALQLLSALAYLASREPAIIHRDIKPKNIFLKGHSVVLGDFGLMKAVTAADEGDRDVLKHSVGAGMAFYYRTPDLVRYARHEALPTPKSDVFQLGLVLAELFTGRNPCKATTDFRSDVELENVAHVPSSFSPRIAGLLKLMLEMDPASRQPASDIMNGWLAMMSDAVEAAHALNGKVF